MRASDHFAKVLPASATWWGGWSIAFSVVAAHWFRTAATLGLWIDELYTLNAIELSWGEMLVERAKRGHPPLFFILEKLVWSATSSFSNFMSPELRLRLLPYGFWLLAVGIFAVQARRFLGVWGYRVAISVFAFSQIAGNHAANARMYSLVTCIAVVHLFEWLSLLRQERTSLRNAAFYVATGILGILASPTFGLVVVACGIALVFVNPSCRWRVRLALSTLLLSFLAYSPMLYLYWVTPHQLGPVSKNSLRVLKTLPALLTGIGRGQVPDEAGMLVRGVVALSWLLLAGFVWMGWRNRNLLSVAFRPVFAAFSVPYLLWFAAYATSLLPNMESLRFGTDRYFVAISPLGALLAGCVAETWRSTRWPLGFTAMTVAGALVLNFGSTHDNRRFSEEMRALCGRVSENEPVLVSPPHIAAGVRLYCPHLNVQSALGIDSRDEKLVKAALEPLARAGGGIVIYYRGHVPELLQIASRDFATSEVLSRKIYGSPRDPLFAIIRLRDPRSAPR